MNPSRESEVGLGTAATKDERQEDGEEGGRRRGAGAGAGVGGGLGGWRRSVPMPIPFRVRAGVE